MTGRTVQKWLRGGCPREPTFWGIMELARGVPGGYELMLCGEDGSDGESQE